MSGLNYKLNPSQINLWKAKGLRILALGGKGSGKSWAMLLLMLSRAAQNPKYRAAYVRISWQQMQSMEYQLDEWATALGGRYFRSTGYKRAEFPNGSRVFLTQAKDSSDARTKLMGYGELDCIAVDEANLMNEAVLNNFQMHLRSANPYPKQLYFLANPGGPGIQYLKQKFLCRVDEAREANNGIIPKVLTWVSEEINYTFVHSVPADNFAIQPEDYIKQLGTLSPAQQQMYIHGEYNVGENSFFTQIPVEAGVFDEVSFKYDRFIVSIDPGRVKPAVVYGAIDYNGMIRIFDVISVKDSVIQHLIDRIKQKNEILGIEPYYVVDPSYVLRNSINNKTIKTVFDENGIYTTLGINKRVPGWRLLRELFESNLLVIDKDRCTPLIESLQALQTKETDPEDCIKESSTLDDFSDALRYLVMFNMALGDIPKTPQEIEIENYNKQFEEHLKAVDPEYYELLKLNDR